MSQSKTRRPMVVSRLAVRSVATIAALALCGFGATGVASASADSPEVSEEPVVTEEVVVPEVIEEPTPVVEEPAPSEPISEPEPVVVEQQDVASSDRSEQATTSKSGDKSDKGHKPGKGDKGKPGGHKPPDPEPPVEPEEPTPATLVTIQIDDQCGVDNDNYVPPTSTEAVTYVPNYNLDGSYTVTATANEGYVLSRDGANSNWVFAADNLTATWTFFYTNVPCETPEPVTPPTPVCDANGSPVQPEDTEQLQFYTLPSGLWVTSDVVGLKPGNGWERVQGVEDLKFTGSCIPTNPGEPTVVVPEQPVCNKNGETLLPANTDAIKYELDSDAKVVTATIIKPGFTFDENELNGYEVGYVDDETGVVAVLLFDVSDCKPVDNGGGEPNPTNPGGNNGGNQPPTNPNPGGNNGGNQPPANAGGTPTPVDNSTPGAATSDDTKKKESLKGGNYVTGVDAPNTASPLFIVALLLGLVFAIFALLPAAMQDRITRRFGVRMQS